MDIKEKIKKIKLSRLIFYSKYIIVKDGKLFDVCYNIFIPENSTINGNLWCIDYKNKLKELPDNLTVNGDLDCYSNNLTELPDNLTVNGQLWCSYNIITELPDNLTVNGNLYCGIQKSGVKLELPKSAKVKGRLYN